MLVSNNVEIYMTALLSTVFYWTKSEPRSLNLATTTTMVGGPREFGGIKGCDCIFEGGSKVLYCIFEDLDQKSGFFAKDGIFARLGQI